MIGDLADVSTYDIPPIVGGDPSRDPRQGLPLWALQADALRDPIEPKVGMWPDPARELRPPPDTRPMLSPDQAAMSPETYINPVANAATRAAVPTSTTDLAMTLMPGGMAAKATAGAIGSLFDADPAEAARWIKYPVTGIAVGDTPANLAKLNKLVPIKDIYESHIAPHDIPVGSWLTPLVGDRSPSGQLLTHVGEKELQSPVSMQGGYQFMPEWLKQQIAWASDKSPSSAIANRVRGFAGEDTPGVYGVYTSMSPVSVDASHHMSDTLSQMLKLERDKVGETAADKFNALMRTKRPDFPGVTDEELQAYLRNAPMSFRDYFTKTMNQKSAREAGFPDVAQARIAATHPALMDTPNYSGGQAIARMSGDVVHGELASQLAPHYTYRSKLPGRYIGGFGRDVPQELLWRDLTPKIAARDPSAVGKIWLTGLKGERFGQLVDPQWQDAVAEYLRRNPPMGSLAKQY